MNNYLIPANSKKGQLIFNLFRGIDLIIVLIGVCVTTLLLFVIPGDGLWSLFFKLLPIGISILLVMPIPYRHNVLVYLTSVFKYLFIEQKRYIWKGWCVTDELNGQQK